MNPLQILNAWRNSVEYQGNCALPIYIVMMLNMYFLVVTGNLIVWIY